MFYKSKKRKISSAGYKISLFELTLFLLKNPKTIRFVLDWYQTLQKNATSLLKEIPWLTYEAIDWLRNYLKPHMKVFEYGTGGSTIFISKRVKTLISVEHDRNWSESVNGALEQKRILNSKVILQPPEQNNAERKYGPKSYISITFPEYKGMSFKKYVTIIDNYPDLNFDLILIDGRARASCIYHSIKKVRRGGYIMLDNSKRPYCFEAIRLLSKYKKRDFFGFGPFLKTFWQTSIWQIKS